MKKHLLFNQSFGTVGSPNQTGETLTRENRIGLMSYLRRTLMLLFAVLVMSIANIGMAWADTLTETHNGSSAGVLNYTSISTTSGTITYHSNSSAINVGSNTSASFTVSSFDGSNISSIVFTQNSSYPINTLTTSDGEIVKSENTYTFTPSSLKTSYSFTLTAQEKKNCRVTTVAVTLKSNDGEYFSKNFSYSGSSAPYTINATKSNASTDISISANNNSSLISSSALQLGNGKQLTIASSGHNIKKIVFVCVSQGTMSNLSANTGTYSSNVWTAGADTKTVTFTSSGSNANIVLIRVDLASGGGCTSISPTWSTDYSSTTLNVGATSSIPVVGKGGSSGAVTFSSSDTYIATVNSSGVVTGVGAGTATITATVAANGDYCSGTVTKEFTIKAGVTYDANSATGGSVPTDDNTYAYNANITVKGNTGSLYKTGKVFNGWNTRSDGTGTHYEADATMKMPSKSTGVTLYAEWVGYATSWEWWNCGQSNNSTTFTYITSKNYICSFASSASTAVASWDIEGGVAFRGVKIKTKDHNLSFWVQTGKQVSITFGTMTTKPTFTVGGVDKSGDLSTGSDSLTVTYTTTGDTKFYIENETATNTAFTVKSVKIEDDAPSCTAPDHVDISGDWDYFGGETISLTATAYDDSDAEIAAANITGYQWKHNGVDIDGATSKTFTKTTCTSADGGDYSCVVSTGATCSTESSPMGIKVYVLQCYTGGETTYNFTRTGSSQAGTTEVTLSSGTQYEFKIYAGSTASTDYHMGNNGTIDEDASNWDFEGGKNNVKLNSGLGGTFTFAIDYSANGGAPKVSVTYPRKTIYLNPGGSTYWDKDNAKFGIHYFRQDAGSGWTDLMTAYPCGSGIYVAEIPQWNGVKIDAVRLNPSATNNNKSDWWTSYKYNQTNDCPVTSNDYITITGWGEANYTYTTYDAPEYTISFDGNGETSGSMTDVEDIECDASVTLEANAFVKTGYTFTGWKDGSSNDYADETTISNIRADIELTAQWTEDKHSVTVAAGSNGTVSPTSVSNVGIATASGNITATPNTGYHFTSWTLPSGTSAASEYSSTSNPIHINATADDKTITANFSANTPTITLDNQDATNTPTGSVVATYGSSMPEIATLPTKTGYTFGGFYSDVAGGGTQYYTNTGASAKNSDLASATTLYALWTQSVTIDDNGGSADGSVDVTYKGTAGTPSVPTYAGHTVDLGYYAESSCTNKVMALDGTLQTSVTDGSSVVWTNSSSKWAHAGASTLYAHWKCNTPEISCSSNTITISVPSGATVYYTTTTDGSTPADPTSSSTAYNPSSKPTISADTKIKAIAIQSGCTSSDVASADCKYVAECPSSASGSVVYKWEVKSNVTDGNICTTQNVAVSLNTTSHLTTLTGGTLQGLVTSSSMNNLSFSSGRIQYANGGAGVLILTLNCAVKTGDVIRFVNYSSSASKYNYLRHTSSSTTTNQITLNASTTAGTVQEIVVPSAFNNKEELYIVAGSNTTGISYFEIIRPYVVTLDASTNGGKVGGANTATYYAASGEEIALPHAFKSGNYFNGWFPNASTGDAVSNPYTPTGSTTLYAQFGDCPDEGTVYKFQVATGLTNGNVTEGEVNLGNYVSALEGGSLTAHQNSSKLTIVSNSKIQFADNNVYLKIDLDCALQTGDKFITSIETDKLCITNTGSRSTTNELVVGTKTETDVPAAFVGSKTLWIWRNGTNSKITYFEIIRPNGVTITGAVSPDGYGTVSPASIFVASGSTVSLASNVLTCDGKTLTATPTAATAEYTYAFSSWSGVTNGGTVSVATTATANFTRTANNYTLAWSSNGGSDLSGSYTSGSTAYGASITAPNDPTLSNYTFDGWKTNNDGTGTTAGATMPAANTTYYAAWKQTVTLTTGAQGEGGNQTPYVYLNGTGVSNFTAHTASGYSLQGYYTAGSGGVKVLNADGTFAAANVTDYITSSKWSRTGAAPTLYAQWVASEDCSTSDFVIQKGSSEQYQGCMESSSYNGTATSFTAGSPTTVGNAKMTISNYDGGIKRPGSGNTFSIVIEPVSGYYLKSICWAGKVESGETVSYYWDDASGSATTISAQTTSGTGVTYNAPSSTTKFTASYVDDGVDGGGIWWRNVQVEVCAAGVTTYSVTYDGNDETSGSVPTGATNYSYGATVTVLGNTGSLEKDGYTFAGWTTNNNGTGSSYEASSTFSITANTTLYAKWTQAVTLDKNGGSTDGSATAVWNATGLTGITHAKPAAGYKLLGYYSASSDGTKVLNSDGSFAATNVTGYITSGKWSRTSATTLYAEYESAGALTWNLIVNSDTTNLSTSTKTSAFTEISTTNMTNATLAGDLTYEKSKKSALTGKISTPASYDADDYVYVTFQVASGYKFTPSMIQVPVQPVGNGEHKAVELRLTDTNTHSLVSGSATKCDGTEKGKKTTVTLAGDGTYFTGTVTLKIYVYAHATASATTYNCYRLGTPIEIQGEVEALCATMPSYTSMSYTTTSFLPDADASGSPITIVGGDNINTYQWKYNTVNDRTSGTNCGTGTSLTPLTDEDAATDGTRYYWCEMTNTSCGITIKSPAVAITVAAAKSDASVTWTNPESTPNYGGGGYTIKATVDQTGWDGNAADLVITAPAGINIYNVTSGTTSSQKWVQADFDVQTSFDRSAYASNIPFTVSAAATATYNAISDDHNVSYSACSGGGGGSSYNIRVRKSYDKDASNNYRWVTPGAGEITYAVGSSISSGKAGTAMATVFDSIMSSDKQYIWVKTFVGNIKQMRLYVETSGANISVSALYQRTTYAAADAKDVITGYSVVYDEDDDAENTGTKGQHTIDLIFTSALSANDIICVKFSSSKVKALGAAITEGSAGSLNTYLQWSGGLENGATVAKYTTDAYFTYSASKITENTNTLGAITYSSSNTSVATVDATGKVALIAAGSTTIKATLAASGCYKKAEISYTLNVMEVPCAITAGTLTLTSGTESKCSSANVTLTLTGFESGASIQWKDGDTDINNGGNYTIATDGTTSTLTTNQEGTYSVMVTKDCSVRSNRITISNKSTEVGAKRIVKNWYIKNGRLTPDIELWTLQNGAHLSSVAWDPANTTGLTASDFYESDGKVYLKGKEPSSNTSGEDIDYTLTLTVEDDCGSTTTMSAAGQLIYLHHQKNTDKHVLAFVVTGTEKGGFTEGITADQTTSVELYNTIAANFDVLATNVYSTDDEQALKEYYSQFDILCVTDYPNTGTKGVNKKSYVDALGALVDIRPILTMEAFVAKLANWKAKGISGTPQSPTTRQYTMLLQCKDHEIFSGTELTKVGEGDETMYRVSMVDNTQEEYVSLDATYGEGAHAEKSGYNYGGKPALQGFTFTKEMLDDDLLPLGLIDDGSGNDLQVGIERQTEMEARLMVLGINSYAMERLTDDGQTVVVNALKYLMKKNSEDIADCSNTFVGGDDEEDVSTRYDWNVDSHWSGNAIPDRTQKVRIVAPCVIPANVKPHVTGVIIAPSGKYNHGANTANGSLTIAAGGALIVDGKVEAATAPLYTETRATSAEDLTIQTSSTAQGALIFDNDKGDTKATVNLYSLGRKDGNYQYQYFAVPMEVVPVNPTFANETHGGTGIYTYVYNEATSGWTRRKYYDDLFAFEGLGITTKSTGAMEYTMTGNLASTATKEITLTHDGAGLNLIGNSWMAPIQIGALAEDNTDANITKTVYIYCAGRDAVEGAATSGDTETAGQWLAVPFEAAEFETWKAAGKLSVIPAMQAFQIKVDAEATLTLDYDKVVRGSTNDLNAKLRAPGRRMAANEVTMTNIRVADSKTHTDLSLFEGDRFSEAFDNGWEAEYMNGDGRSAKLYAETEAGQMAVAAMYDYEGTVVGFAPGQETEYTFSFMGEDNGYYLNDIKLQNSVRISEGETYTFTYEEGDAANRFYISRTAINAPEVATGMENLDAAAPKVQKIIYNDKLYIIRGGRLYDATGKVVK